MKTKINENNSDKKIANSKKGALDTSVCLKWIFNNYLIELMKTWCFSAGFKSIAKCTTFFIRFWRILILNSQILFPDSLMIFENQKIVNQVKKKKLDKMLQKEHEWKNIISLRKVSEQSTAISCNEIELNILWVQSINLNFKPGN